MNCSNSEVLRDVITRYGTPTFIYDRDRILRQYRILNDSFGDRNVRMFYAMKANGHLAILQTFREVGGGIDLVSVGEIARAKQVGFVAADMVFSGVGKTRDELAEAISMELFSINCESVQELKLIAKIAQDLGKTARVSLRVNPNIDAQTHPYISTGLKDNKFGIDIAEAMALYHWMNAAPNILPVGIACHIGSQMVDLSPMAASIDLVLDLVQQLSATNGISLDHIDIGGGFAVDYAGDGIPSIDKRVRVLLPAIDRAIKMGLLVCCEPGRFLVAESGMLLAKVLYTKENSGNHFAIIDAAMNNLIRPALYGAVHQISMIDNMGGDGEKTSDQIATQMYDVVGPVCESGDFLARAIELPILQPGDHIAIHGAANHTSRQHS